MVDFSKLGPLQNKTCNECGQDFTTHLNDNDTCSQCAFYRNNPEMSPKYWTWTRITKNQWGIIAHWPEQEDPPSPGDTLVVHRKDSSTSVETVKEVLRTSYSTSLRLRVHCLVM